VGREKEEMIQKEDNWNAKARREGIHCPECGSLIEYDDREIYFSTGKCGRCNDYEQKDD
jgi:hypothetical protein